MACSPAASEAGYATPAALVLALALAMAGSALVLRSVQMLRLTRAEFEQARQVLELDGAQLEAVADVVRSGVPGPYHWTFSSDSGWMEAIAEPEADKLTPAAASTLDDAALAAFGVTSPAGLRDGLAAQSGRPDADIAGLDPSPLWRECGPSLVSPLGGADTLVFHPRVAPGPGPQATDWHVGETWRIRVASADGWRDDRIMRFTGDARHPAAVVTRRLTHGDGRGGECEEILRQLAGA